MCVNRRLEKFCLFCTSHACACWQPCRIRTNWPRRSRFSTKQMSYKQRFQVNRQVKLNQNLHHDRGMFADRQTEHNLSYCPSHRSSIRLHLQFAWLNSMSVSSSLSFFSHPFLLKLLSIFSVFFRSDLLLRFFHVQITIEVMTCSEMTIRLYRHLKAPQIPFSAFKLTNPNSERAPFIRTPCFKSNREDTLLYF